MYNFTNTQDYKEGVYKLPQNSLTIKELSSFIISTEEDILECLLGCDLYELFMDSIDESTGISSEDRFNKIIDKLCFNIDSCRELKSKGIKRMIQGFVYFYYGRQTKHVLTNDGSKKNKSDNSEEALLSSTLLISNYNKSIHYYNNIQEYIILNKDIYPEYKGVSKHFITPL